MQTRKQVTTATDTNGRVPTKMRDNPDDDNEWKMGWEPRQAPPAGHPSTNPLTAAGKSPLMATQPPSPLAIAHPAKSGEFDHSSR